MSQHINDDIVTACADLAGRSGARDFEIGYLHDDVPVEQAGWYAHVQYQGTRITVADQHGGTTRMTLCEIPWCRLRGKHRPSCVDDDCRGCLPRETAEGLVCDPDVEWASADLSSIVTLIPQAWMVAANQTGRGASGAGGKPGSHSPANDDALDALHAVSNALTTICREIADIRGLQTPSAGPGVAQTLTWCARFLQRQLSWLKHARDEQGGPYAAGVFAEIRDSLRRIRGIVDGPSPARFLGKCGAPLTTPDDGTCPVDCECHSGPYAACSEPGGCGLAGCGKPRPTGEDCQGDVYGREGASTGRCRSCGAEFDQGARREQLGALARVSTLVARASVIADSLNLSVKTIRSWATPTFYDTGAVKHPPKLKTYWRTDAGRIVPWTDLPDDPVERATELRKRGVRLHYVADVQALADKLNEQRARREAAGSETAA